MMTAKTKPDLNTFIQEKVNCKERCKCRACYEEFVKGEDPPSVSYDKFQNAWVDEREKIAKAERKKKAEQEAAKVKQKTTETKQPSKEEVNNK